MLIAQDKAADDSSISVAGSVVIEIAGKQYTLTGTVGSAIVVSYHQPFDQAINLGSITGIATEVAEALGAKELATKVNEEITKLTTAAPPLLVEVIKVLTTANVRITDLAINTATHTYQFGFALDFTSMTPPIRAADVTLDAFGLVVTYSKSS